MRLGTKALVLCAGLLFAGTAQLAAQAWDTPSFQPPIPAEELGIYLISPNNADLGVVGIWRTTGPLNLGIRAGLLDHDSGLGVIAGADARGLITRAPAFPMDLAWTLGAGLSFNGETFVRIPIGVSLGRGFGFAPFILYPYAHPRLGIDLPIDTDDVSTQLSFNTDFGLDALVAQNLMLRFGVSLGEFTALGFGLTFLRAVPAIDVAAR